MRIQHNIASMNVHRNLKGNNSSIGKTLEKLSSGYRINRAGDDAAGLAVSEKMRAQITGLKQACQNADDGISLVQTVEGALTEVHSMLDRMMELSVQSANGTYSDDDRSMMNDEIKQIKSEISRIGNTATFNSTRLFPEAGVNGSREGVSTYKYTLDLTNKICEVNYINEASTAGGVSRSGGGHRDLADKIAGEYLPNAVNQIIQAFPSLGTAIGNDKIDIAIEIRNIDGSNGTLAYASYSYNVNGKPFNMKIRVDAADFTDASMTGPDAEKLESTLAHELMHSVMQYTMTDQMSGRGGSEKFPEWFVEGTAQLAGGGFPTNWNAGLEQIAGSLTGAGDTSKDTAVGDYLKQYSVAGRPYGHGYLASAYIGYLASGGTGSVTDTAIARGMDEIFKEVMNGNSLYGAISKLTNGKIKSESDLNQLFSSADSDLVKFVRELSFASKGGAGSVIAGGLGTGGGNIIGSQTNLNSPFQVVDKAVFVPSEILSAKEIYLMVGSDSDVHNLISVELYEMNADALGLMGTNVLGDEDALFAIEEVNTAIDMVSFMRGYYGALQNRLEHTVSNLGNVIENLSASESRIRDTDMAKSMMEFVRGQILVQSSQSMLAQANQQPNAVLQLLGA
ncbi:flagellin [Lachnospiraceae bacterium]|nr:flagellin [Lachnospiraceae bacterium]